MKARHAAAALALVAAFSVLLLGQTPWLRSAENFKSDLFQVYLPPFPPPADDIVIVGIDEAALAGFAYRSPIDRAFLADLIRHIDSNGPKAIALDLLLDTPTESSKDEALITALNAAKAPLFVAVGTAEDGLTDAQTAHQKRFLKSVQQVSVVLARDNADAVVRHFQAGRRNPDAEAPSLAAALAGRAPSSFDGRHIRLAYPGRATGWEIPFPVYPANAVQLLPGEWFTGKYVLIGIVIDAVDTYRTPFVAKWGHERGSFPGVVIHAYALDQLLRGHTVWAAGPAATVLLTAIFCLAAAALLRTRLPLSVRIGLLGLSLPLYVFVSALLYMTSAVLIAVIVPVAAVVLSSGVYGIALWQRDRQEKAFIRNAWSRYVSPEVVQQLIDHPDRLRLGGEQRRVTYLFTDIAGFTALTENLPPGKTAELLNAYLDGIFDLFRAKGGTIDKTVGDAVIGMFGAPVIVEDQEQRAVELAIEIDRFCTRYSAQQNESGFAFGQTRIGVNTGMALVGNFGGTGYFDYTGLGDTVNTAARLESANKALGTRLCVSGSTRAEVNGISFRKIGAVSLAGKEMLTDAFEPVPEIDKRHLELYNAAYSEMECGSNKAVGLFNELLADYPGDRLAQQHSARMTKTGIVTARIDLLIK